MSPEQNPFASPAAVDEATPTEAFDATAFPELRRVRTGLTCVYVGICGLLLWIIASPVIGIAFARVPDPASVTLLAVVMAVGMFGLSALVLLGEALCIFVPAESGAKAYAVAAVVLQLATLAIGLVANLVDLLWLQTLLEVLSQIAWLASFGCFAFFMRRLAAFLGRDDLVRRSTRLFLAGGIAAASVTGMIISLASSSDPAPTGMFFLPLAMVTGITALVALVMYANLATYLRKAIAL